jgi:hypothetical protein
VATKIPAELYRLDHDDTHNLVRLDYVERNRYIGLRRVGIGAAEALSLAREVEDPLPELGELAS